MDDAIHSTMTYIKSPARMAAVSTLLFAFAAQANLIQNGSFEDLTGLNSPSAGTAGSSLTLGQWGVYQSIPGWTTLSGSGIELQYAPVVAGTPTAADGNVYVELDSHPEPGDAVMGQSLNLAAGDYCLSFAYKPRTTTVGDNKISALWQSGGAGESFVLQLVTANLSSGEDWMTFTRCFTLSKDMTGMLIFAADEDIAGSTMGGFLDNVVLTRVTVPDAGSSLALLGLGILGMAAFRRARRAA